MGVFVGLGRENRRVVHLISSNPLVFQHSGFSVHQRIAGLVPGRNLASSTSLIGSRTWDLTRNLLMLQGKWALLKGILI